MGKRIIYLVLFFMFLPIAYAQRPENYPDPDQGPPEITILNIVLYFVVPLLIIVAYIWTRRISYKKKTQQQRDKH